MINIMDIIFLILNRNVLQAYVILGLKPPSSREVRRVLHQLLGDRPFPETPTPTQTGSQNVIHFSFSSLAGWFRNPLLIIIIIVFLVGLFFLITNLAPYIQNEAEYQQRNKKEMSSRKVNPTQSLLDVLYQQAIRQSQIGQHRQALISLHKATVEYLLTKVMIISPGKKYTNNDLKKKLRAQTLYQPFVLIANYAEIAGFSNAPIQEADFLKALKTFEVNFR